MSPPPSAGAVAPTQQPAGRPGGTGGAAAPSVVARWLATPEASVLLVLLVLWVYMFFSGGGKLSSGFFSEQNRDNLSRSVSLLAIFAVGELLVILTGGIDLSVGSLIAFTGMLVATAMNGFSAAGMGEGAATVSGVAVALLFSLALGLLHATLVHFLRLPPFVVTLGSMSMLRSAALLFNNGVPVPIEKFQFLIYLGNKKLYIAGTPLGLPVTTVILAVIALIMAAVMAGTGIGRRVYSVGSNEDASRLSGVDVFRVKAFVYCTCSLLAGLAGVLYAGYSQQGDPRSGAMFELNAISAAVIGGALLTGGRGSIAGTLLGAVLLGSIVSMINFRVGDPARWEGMVVGAVLLLAVIFNRLRQIRFFENLWARAFGHRPAAHPAG